MPIPTQLLATITGRLAPSNGPATAAHALAVWTTMFGKFAPLLGPLGAQLVFAQSLARVGKTFAWLPRPAPNAQQDAFGAFESCLDGLEVEALLAVNRALLDAYTAALVDLIGERLATRLLRSAFPEDGTDKNTLENTA